MVLRMGMEHRVFWPENGSVLGELGKKPIPSLRGEVPPSQSQITPDLCVMLKDFTFKSICSLCIP